MAHDVELVEQDARLRCVALGRVPKRLPHVHHGQANPRALLGSQPLEELVHAGLGAVLAAEPDRTPTFQIAHHDAVGVTLADRYLVDADDLRPGRSGTPPLLAHVLLLELLDRMPFEPELIGDILDRRGAAALADVEGEPLGVAGILGQEVQPLALHCQTTEAANPANLDLQEDPQTAAGEIADSAYRPIVEAVLNTATGPARRFFERRTSVTTRAPGSPKMPATACRGRRPEKRYESESRWRGRDDRIAQS